MVDPMLRNVPTVTLNKVSTALNLANPSASGAKVKILNSSLQYT